MSAPDLINRLAAMNELFTPRDIVKPDAPVNSATPACGIGRFHAVTFSNGPVKPSRMRSNSTPIWNASVHPALSYGGVGGPPGIGNTSGCTCGSNMSITCGRNDCAVKTTNEPAG